MKSKAFDHSKYAHWIDPNTVTPYEKNAKIHTDKQIKNIVNSIRRFGWQQDTVITADNVLVIGHGRRLAAIKLCCEMPYHVIDKTADELTDDDIRELRIADNQTNAETGFDFDALTADIDGLDFEGFDFDFGIDMEEQDEEPIEIVEDEPPTETETRCKVGDLWQLGEHRLVCGNSTDVNVIDRLMDGVKADMVMTDPPYGINAEKMTMGSGAKEFYRGKDWDSKRPDISIAFTLADNICIWGGNYFADVLPISNDWLVWHKKNDGLSFSECELAWTNFGRNVRHISHHWGNEKKLHVTMKPVEVIAWAIQQAKEKAEVIVDLFGGSGSTLIACEQLNRKCYMAELSPEYCDVILQRWENFTGQKAVKLNNE